MAYTFTNSKGTKYILHARVTTLKNGKTQTLYYFAKAQGQGALDRVPAGYMVVESKNGLPILKKS
jgi:hypothetical protein